MSGSDDNALANAKRAARAAASLQQAVLLSDAEACFGALREVMSFDIGHLERMATPDEVELRRISQEIADAALRQVILGDADTTESWRRLMLPSELGVMAYTPWVSNGRWLRLSGSTLVEDNDEVLDPRELGRLGLADQARRLGRYCVVNDGAREVDVAGVLEVLDRRLLPFFVDWLLGVHNVSPTGLPAPEVEARQEAVQELLDQRCLVPTGQQLAASPFAYSALYDRPYRSDAGLRSTAELVGGQLSRGIFERFRAHAHPLKETPEVSAGLAAARAAGSLVLCPNWRDSHVALRCMGPLLEGLRREGAPVCMPQEVTSGLKGLRAGAWGEQSFEVHFEAGHHFLVEATSLAETLGRLELDLLFYPEITPANSSAWLATQRLARVQATGYGFPATTGSPHMDYFVGGAEVEPEGAEADYTEQLVLLPGFGVSTLIPPLPTRPRRRPVDDSHLHVVSIASHRKLKEPLLRAWTQILADRPGSSMDLFPAMQPRDLVLHVPAMAKIFGSSAVDLHPIVERQVILDTLVEADLYLDTYPFGGFNSLVEVLASGCPFVTLEGDQARNRFGAAMLRRVGLPEFLIARTYAEYVEAAERVLGDAGLRRDLRAQLADRERVLELLVDPDMAEHFDAARRWMLEQGPRRGRPGKPVLIRAGERPLALSA